MNSFDWTALRLYVLARLGERSTWMGVIALLTAGGMSFTPELAEHIASLGAGIAGVLLIATADKPKA